LGTLKACSAWIGSGIYCAVFQLTSKTEINSTPSDKKKQNALGD